MEWGFGFAVNGPNYRQRSAHQIKTKKKQINVNLTRSGILTASSSVILNAIFINVTIYKTNEKRNDKTYAKDL